MARDMDRERMQAALADEADALAGHAEQTADILEEAAQRATPNGGKRSLSGSGRWPPSNAGTPNGSAGARRPDWRSCPADPRPADARLGRWASPASFSGWPRPDVWPP